jgi:transposase
LENAVEPTTARKRSANYPLAFKRKLAQRACDENVSVAQLALEHGLNTNMVFKWRRDLRAGRLDGATALLPVSVTPNAPLEQSTSAVDGMIEIRIGAAVVRIEGAPDSGTLGVILQGLLR